MAQVCGQLNALSGELVGLIREARDEDLWSGQGIRTLAHWVALHTGCSLGRAAGLVELAKRADELPATAAALVEGRLSEDQAVAIAKRAPAYADTEVCDFAQAATVSQLTRTLAAYPFPEPEPTTDEEPEPVRPRPRRVSSGFDDHGDWVLHARLRGDEGAIAETALRAHLDALINEYKAHKASSQPGDLDDQGLPDPG